MVASPLTSYHSELVEYWVNQQLPQLRSEQAVLNEKMKKEKAMIAKGKGSPPDFHDMMEELSSLETQMKLPPKLLVGETTEQALQIALAGQPNEAVGNFNPEARGLVQIILGKFGSGSDSTGETLYCAGYSGDPYSVERNSRDHVNLKNPCLSVLFMLQPDSMRKLTTSDSMTVSGFLPRFLMADIKADFQDDTAEDRSIKHDTKENWSDLLNDLLDFYRKSKEKMTVRVSSKAAQLLRDESNRIGRLGKNGASHAKFSSYVFRYGENLRKLHLVLHIATHGTSSHTTEASDDTARNAITISQWFFNESMSLLKAGEADKLLKRFEKVVGILNKSENKEITLRDLRQNHTITEDDIKELQDTFPDTLEIIEKKPPTGRPSIILKLAE